MNDNLFRDILEHVMNNKLLNDDDMLDSISKKFDLSKEETERWYDSVITELATGNY